MYGFTEMSEVAGVYASVKRSPDANPTYNTHCATRHFLGFYLIFRFVLV